MHRSDYSKRRDLPSVTPDEMKGALRQLATGVTVVTAEHDGEMYGITVSAFASISLDPPIVMVSINNGSPLAAMIVEAEHFAVHILSSEQEHISGAFARPVTGSEKFSTVQVNRARTGAPLFDGALAVLDCALEQTLIVGTHTVMFGRVVHVVSHPSADAPLLYYHQSYRRLAGGPAPDEPRD